MPCRTIYDDSGKPMGIACSRGRRAAPCQVPQCGRPHTALCDFPLTGPKAGQTCDFKLCDSHRIPQPGKNRDYCSAHDRLAKQPQQEESPA